MGDITIETFNYVWGLLGALILGLMRLVKWAFDLRKAKTEEQVKLRQITLDIEAEEDKSTELLLNQLEILKTKLVKQVGVEIELYNDKAHNEKLLYLLKLNCPDCYQEVMDIYKEQLDEKR